MIASLTITGFPFSAETLSIVSDFKPNTLTYLSRFIYLVLSLILIGWEFVAPYGVMAQAGKEADIATADALMHEVNETFSADVEGAIHKLEQASRAYLRAEHHTGYVQALNFQGVLYSVLALYAESDHFADSAWKEATRLLQPKNPSYLMAKSNYLAMLSYNNGDQGLIKAGYEEILAVGLIPQNDDEYHLLGGTHFQLGVALIDLKDYPLAIQHLRACIRYLIAGDATPSQLSQPYASLGEAYGQSTNPDSALFFFKKAFKCTEADPYSISDLLSVHESIGTYFIYTQQYDSAIYYAQKAKSLASEETLSQFNLDLLEGAAHLEKGAYAAAIRTLQAQEASRIKLFGQEGNPLLYSNIRWRLGEAYLRTGRPEEAAATLWEGLHRLSTDQVQPDPTTYATYFPDRAARLWGRYAQTYLPTTDTTDLFRAKAALEAAKRMHMMSYSNFSNNEAKAALIETLNWIYESLLDVLWELYQQTGNPLYLREALARCEESKTQLMRINMQDAWSKMTAGVPDTLRAHEQHLRKVLDKSRYRLRQASQQKVVNSHLLDSLEQVVFDQTHELLAFGQELETTYPRYAQLKYRTSLDRFYEAMDHPTQDIWLGYWGEESLYYFIHKAGKWSWQKVPMSEVRPLTTHLIDLLQHPQENAQVVGRYQGDSHTLYQMMGLGTFEPSRSVIIIPDGPLHFLPFEALATRPASPTSTSTTWTAVPYWGLSQAIRYEYSLVPFPDLALPPQSLADWYGLAPSYEGIASMIFNQEEVVQIGALLSADYLAGQSATKQHFFQAAPLHHWLHFAGHARADQRFPLQSHLEFSDSTNAKLYAWEVYNMQLPAEVLVLSGCETGSGKYLRGEGVMGLARAFRYAGVPNIIQSVWQADGQATQSLMTFFYEAFQESGELTPSLQQARNRFFQEMPPRFHHPYYWANFVLVGPDLAPKRSPWMLWGGILGMSLLVFGGWWLWRSRAS